MGKEYINIKTATEDLQVFTDVLTTRNIIPYLLFGTLLGYHRDRQFIEHDTDIDLGLHEEYRDSIVNMIEDIKRAGFEVLRSWQGLLSFKRKGVYIDLYFFSRDKSGDWTNKIVTNEGKCTAIFRMKKEDFEKPNKVKFAGRHFLTPSNERDYLMRHYGYSYMKPIHNKHSNPFQYDEKPN